MRFNKIYQINRTNTYLEKISTSAFFYLTFRPLKAFSIYLLHKTKVVFIVLKETDNIAFLDLNKNVLIQDKIKNYTFYKPTRKILEIEHPALKKNIPLILDKNVNSLYNYLDQRQTKFEKPKKISFWEIMELIFMP